MSARHRDCSLLSGRSDSIIKQKYFHYWTEAWAGTRILFCFSWWDFVNNWNAFKKSRMIDWSDTWAATCGIHLAHFNWYSLKKWHFSHYPCPGTAATRLIKAFQHHSVWDFHQGQFHVSQRGNRSDTLTARNSYSLIATYSTSSRLRENPVDFVPLGVFFLAVGNQRHLPPGVPVDLLTQTPNRDTRIHFARMI